MEAPLAYLVIVVGMRVVVFLVVVLISVLAGLVIVTVAPLLTAVDEITTVGVGAP